MVAAGKTYVDQHNSRRLVLAVDGEPENYQVHYLLPITQHRETCSLSDFEAWAVGEYQDPFGG